MAAEDIIIKVKVDDSDLRKMDQLIDQLTNSSKGMLTAFEKMSRQYAAQRKQLKDIVEVYKELAAAIKDTQKVPPAPPVPASPTVPKVVGGTGLGLGSLVAGLSISSLAMQGLDAIKEGLVSTARHVFEVTKEFQTMETVLTTTLGSNSAAKGAMKDIEGFAARTPFSVSEITQSFIKLANQGFVATTDQLERMGDLASSLNKPLEQVAEAILDAQRGQFVRLEELGIMASKANGEVTLSFKGVQKVVKDNDEAIRTAILSFGEMAGVAGNMAAISGTLEGKVSNLGDSWDSLGRAIGNTSSGAMSAFIDSLGQSVQGITKMIELTRMSTPINERLATSVAQGTAEFEAEFAVLSQLQVESAKNADAKKQYSEMLTTVNSKYAEFLPNQLSEKSNLDDIASAYNVVSKAINEKMLVQAAEAMQTEALKNLINLEKERISLQVKQKQEQNSTTQGFIDGFLEVAEKTPTLGAAVGLFYTSTNEAIDRNNELIAKTKDEIKQLPDAIKQISAELGVVNTEATMAARSAIGKMTSITEVEARKAKAIRDNESKQIIEAANDRLSALEKIEANKNRVDPAAAKKAAEDEKKLAEQIRKARADLAQAGIQDEKVRKMQSLNDTFAEEKIKVAEAGGSARKKAELLKLIEEKYLIDSNNLWKEYLNARAKNELSDAQKRAETATQQELNYIEELNAEGQLTEKEYAKAKEEIDMDSLSRRLINQREYLSNIDASTKEGADLQKKAAEDVAATELHILENLTKQKLAKRKELEKEGTQRLELTTQIGDTDAAVLAFQKLGEAQQKNAANDVERGKIAIDTEEKIKGALLGELDTRQAAAEKALQLAQDKGDLKGAKKAADELKFIQLDKIAIIESAFQKEKEAAEKAGVEIKGLEDKKNKDILAAKEEQAAREKEIEKQKHELIGQIQQQAFALSGTLIDADAKRRTDAVDAQIATAQKRSEDAKDRLSKLQEEEKSATGQKKQQIRQLIVAEQQRVKKEEEGIQALEKEKERIQHEAAIKRKAVALAEALINSSLAFTRALTLDPTGILATLTAVLAGIQVAAIIAQPLAKGTVAVTGGIEGKDSVPALLMPGEAVIPAAVARKHSALMHALVNNVNDATIKHAAGYTSTVTQPQGVVNNYNGGGTSVNIDENGFAVYVDSVNSRTKVVNNRHIGR